MRKRTPLTNEKCEDILSLIQNGYMGQDVARITNTSESAVSKIKCIYNALRDNNYEAALRRCQGKKGDPVLTWAIQKLNITIPEDNEQLPIEEQFDPVAAKNEGNEDLVRILSNIEKLLQNLCLNQASAVKEQNANHDILFRAVTSLNNSVLAEMRKYRRF